METSSAVASHDAAETSSADGANSSTVDREIESNNLVMQYDDNQPPSMSQPHCLSGAVGAVVLQTSHELAKESTVVVESEHSVRGTKQLIRMSADNVVTESASRGGWFWSKSSPGHSNKAKVASGTTTGTKTNVQARAKATAKSSGKQKELSAGNKKHGADATDGRSKLPNSSSKGGVSDTSSVSSSDVESVQDHLRFSKNSSLDNPATSTPVRGTERQTEDNQSRQISSTSPPTVSVPNSPLSYAFILPETSINSPTTTAAHMSSFGSATEFTADDAAVSLSVSRQSYAVNAEFDEGRYQLLLREKAGLQGRLDVLERENSEMLRQQAELKQRAVMAEQQIKTFESAGHALNADRSAMAVDLETLRQNRARLEAVIVDAHKLLEEKEEEVQMLERDLELARLAGEKHLEKVADVRREAASRDAIVRDLKAKITELYVQSQTSDQSRQVLEGELAAVRADVAALTEAKEWYASQLRATQKDRSRLQQESASARAETITANVASERLRAENARVKRNLTEVEHRVLTEKQTLARHLEEIEADMLAREAAVMAQLRQVNESFDRPTLVPSSGDDETEELSCLKVEVQRNCERIETMQRENTELSRRLALSQQCVIDRDETVKSLEHDRESAELRAEAAEQDVTLRTADVQRLELERSELQLQLASASKERHLIDQSLQTLRRDTAVLETSFRRMQQDLAAKTSEVEKLSSLKTHRLEDQLSEVWPDTEAAAGLKTSKETPKSLAFGSDLSKTTVVDKEVQCADLSESTEDLVTRKLQDAAYVCTSTTETQTVEPTMAVVTETADMSLTVDNVVLQSEVISSAAETSETVIADTGSRIIERHEKLGCDNQTHLELTLAEKLHIIDRLNEELSSVKASLSKTQEELEVANKHRHALESEKFMEQNREGGASDESLVLNTREDVVRISSILKTAGNAEALAGIHTAEKNGADRCREVQLQTDEVISPTDELRCQFDALEIQLTNVQQELDAALSQKLQLEMAKVAVEAEASTTVEKLQDVEKLLQQTQDDLVRLERQLSEADSRSLEVHHNAVKDLENEKLSLQSQLDELTRGHQKDVSRLKSKVCCHFSDHRICFYHKQSRFWFQDVSGSAIVYQPKLIVYG